MKSLDEVRAAFTGLPEYVTMRQVADATGHKFDSVRTNWPRQPDFPPPTSTGRNQLRSRDAVLAWYEEYRASSAGRPGPRNLVDRARTVAALDVHLSGPQLAEVFGVHPSLIGYYASAHGGGADPFPRADGHGLRSWPEVRSWFLRQAGERGGRTSVKAAEAIRIGEMREGAAASDRAMSASAQWIAGQLGVGEATARQILISNSGPRLHRAELGSAVGISFSMVKYFIHTYGPDGDDPFPPADDRGTRDIAAVKAWLARHRGLKEPSQVLAALEGLSDMVTSSQITAAAGISDRVLREWAKQPGFPPVARIGNARLRERDLLTSWYRARHGLSPAPSAGS
ncbi:hypothetical protein [Kitasatospora phosalacinea]|uniref:Uncharacterized protein n=1 Tax=Kitasatospora phosalacinea TaxID=2065 RepID=A0A9W6PL21_9ACTN|nr:hypothetical protein [Kitasatospora phosalacinea]GLW56806.1 hypothetical protein Kpho01_48170 [Kitasatospora phosalacinea]